MQIVPNSYGVLRESNDCHEPGGSSKGGQFCSGKAGSFKVTDDPERLRNYGFGHSTKAAGIISIEQDGKKGHLALFEPAKDEPQDYLRVSHVAIDSKLRGKGIGSELYRRAIAYAKAKGYKGIASSPGGRNDVSGPIWDRWLKKGVAKQVGGLAVRESNDCHHPAGSSVGGQFCSKAGGKAVSLDDALELVNTYTTWSDEDVLDALDSYGIEGRGETEAQRARRERYGEGEGQQALPGDWSTPASGKAWKDLSVPERLTKLGIDFETIEGVPGMNAEAVYVIQGKDGPLVLDSDGDSKDATEWVNDTDPTDYIDLGDYNEEFWSSDPGETYHATPEENVEDILREGLAPMNKTRGIENRGTGAAVFTSSEVEMIQDSYGPKVFRIDLSAMRRDGYTPEVAEEEPIMEKRAKEALAAKLGLDDFNWEVESGVEETTLVIFGHIPPKYLELLED